MTNIRNSIEVNRRIMIVIAILLSLIIVFLAKFYFSQNRENKALRLKILSMAENKRTPKSWTELMTKPSASVASKTIAPTVTPAPTTTPATTTEVPSLTALDTQEIAVKLNAQMRSVKSLEEKALDDNIAMADEIISREPDSYGAYKAKLISLLVKEGKFNSPADESEVESLLESMAQFNINTDRVARREAALMANANADIRNIEMELDTIVIDREALEIGMASASDPQQVEQLNMQREQLDAKEAQLQNNIINLEQSVAANTSQLAHEDVVEIPFMRMMAQNDYEGVMDNAQDFINQFPNSPNGYFYMIRALEMQGETEQARNLIQNATMPKDVQQSLIQRLESQGAADPKNYWQNLTF